MVVVFALVLMGAVAMIATAFAVLVRTEKKAARNSLLATQAELAALSGLENAVCAIRAANETYSLVSCPDGALYYDDTLTPPAWTFSSAANDIMSGWHRYFEEDTAEHGIVLSDAGKWVWHYNGQRYVGAERTEEPLTFEHEMRGRIFPFPSGSTRLGPPATQTACTGEYAVCVVDLDGKLHSLPGKWDLNSTIWNLGASEMADLPSIIKCWAQQTSPSPAFPQFADGEVDLVVGLGLPPETICRSIREIAALVLPRPSIASDMDAWQQKTYAIEAYMTPYPVGTQRSRLNVNTARIETIKAAICEIPSIEEAAPAQSPPATASERAQLVADYIASRRPFPSRAEFEDAIFLATEGENGDGGFVALDWASDNDEFLTEKEFNDILDSTSTHAELEVVISPDVVLESDGTVTGIGSVSIPFPLDVPVVVTLESSNPPAMQDPGIVTIPALASSVPFDISPLDNLDDDGDKVVLIIGSASGYLAGDDVVVVVDDEDTDQITVSITPNNATEGLAPFVLPGAGTASVPAPVAEDLILDLRSTDTTEATVPGSLTIPAGFDSASFDMTVLPDGLLDDDQKLSVVASALGYRSGWQEFTVTSNNDKYSEVDDSVYDDDTGKHGYYHFDGWELYSDNIGPSQKDGDRTITDRDVTWGCEFKFTSRYFHIYSAGLVRDPDDDRVLARKKLHAVYDAEADKVLWFRWNVTERGNIGDFSP